MLPRAGSAAARRTRHGQRRHMFDWAASHPELAAASAVAAVTAGRALQLEFRTRAQAQAAEERSRREDELRVVKMKIDDDLARSLAREKELELKLRSRAAVAEQQAKRMAELQGGVGRAESALREAVTREGRLQASITERGRLAERSLGLLLEEAVANGHAEGFRLQVETAKGKKPDAVVDLLGGMRVVVDSKAPRPPSELIESNCDEARRGYVDTLKRHIRELGGKRYHADVEGSLSRTWLVLPGEGYVQAAYGPDGSDDSGLHAFAAERSVMVVGPSGLRSALQLATLWQAEAAAGERLGEERVRETLEMLQPVWTDGLLPQSRVMGKDLGRLVKTANRLSEFVKAFDSALRAKDALDLPRARKTSLPVQVDEPAGGAVGEPEEFPKLAVRQVASSSCG